MNSKTLGYRARQKRFYRLLLVALLLLGVTPFSAHLHADQGRNFAGFYAFSEVREEGFDVLLTLHLKVFNVGNINIEAADVTLGDDFFPEQGIAELGSMTLLTQEYDRLHSPLRVSPELYNHWHQHPPMIQVWFVDDGGQEQVFPVELMFMPGLKEE
ncbi:hypothetical protein [Oceanimonas marisflavi]|uniref:hypothetical protein n=1 Tax=Oceanimonas marisflavi TaxID=2059724 RepID=UPI000D3057D0|nr:hypothetical protein [Oceanimonas marisflavi]